MLGVGARVCAAAQGARGLRGDAWVWLQDMLSGRFCLLLDGTQGYISLMPSSFSSQKCLTASLRTCRGVSSPAAMMVSVPLASFLSWERQIFPLVACRAA